MTIGCLSVAESDREMDRQPIEFADLRLSSSCVCLQLSPFSSTHIRTCGDICITLGVIRPPIQAVLQIRVTLVDVLRRKGFAIQLASGQICDSFIGKCLSKE